MTCLSAGRVTPTVCQFLLEEHTEQCGFLGNSKEGQSLEPGRHHWSVAVSCSVCAGFQSLLPRWVHLGVPRTHPGCFSAGHLPLPCLGGVLGAPENLLKRESRLGPLKWLVRGSQSWRSWFYTLRSHGQEGVEAGRRASSRAPGQADPGRVEPCGALVRPQGAWPFGQGAAFSSLGSCPP